MTSNSLPSSLQVNTDFGYYDEAETLRSYLAGQHIYDPAEVADLTARGAPVEPIDGEPDGLREPQAFMHAHGRPLVVLEGALGEAIAALQAARGQHLPATTYLGTPLEPIASDGALAAFIDGFAARVRGAVDEAASSIHQGIAARAAR